MSDCEYKRKIEPHPATARVIAENISEKSLGDPRKWLEEINRAEKLGAKFLLAHAEDGVIWGKFDDDGNLLTSFEASAEFYAEGQLKADAPELAGWGRAQLRKETLWQARIFGENAELFLWRDGDNLFHARVIVDGNASADKDDATYQDAFDEPQILWGTDAKELDNGFTLMTDGAQGMRHAAPKHVESVKEQKDASKESLRPLRLVVRHYLANEDLARIAASRLVNLEVAK